MTRHSKWLKNSARRARRTIRLLTGQDVYFRPQVRCDRVWLGNERAEWCICPTGLSKDSVIYSFGVGEDISFDLELIRRFGTHVHAFDPTPRSILWMKAQTVPAEFHFYDYGIGAVDGNLAFHAPEKPGYVSYSLVTGSPTEPLVEAPVHRLSTIMKMLQHQKIDVLKMDIEGAEYEVLKDMLESEVPVEQLLVEFHHRWTDVGLDKTRCAVRKVMEAGFRIFNVSATGEEYSFIRI